MSQQDIKHREVSFCSLHANPDQAHSAVFILNDLHGVLLAQALDQYRIKITYDLNRINLEEIENILRYEGFHLNNSILAKIRRSIVFYCEEAARENSRQERMLKEVHDRHTDDVIYLRPAKRKLCDCRDQRSDSWRQYH